MSIPIISDYSINVKIEELYLHIYTKKCPNCATCPGYPNDPAIEVVSAEAGPPEVTSSPQQQQQAPAWSRAPRPSMSMSMGYQGPASGHTRPWPAPAPAPAMGPQWSRPWQGPMGYSAPSWQPQPQPWSSQPSYNTKPWPQMTVDKLPPSISSTNCPII